MKSFEASGRTVEEAVSSGLTSNGLSIGDVSVEILEEGSKGLFGLFGSRDARVRLTLKEEEVQRNAHDVFKDSLRDKTPQKDTQPPPKPPEMNTPPAPKPGTRKAPQRENAPKAPAQPRPPRPRKPRGHDDEGKTESKAPAEQITLERKPQVPAVLLDPKTPEGTAQQFLMELTRLMGLDISVAGSRSEEGNVFIQLDGDPQGILIGHRGETLDALQYLTSLKVNSKREEYIRVTLDSEGYRQKREEALVRLANRMANRARKTGRQVNMEPMNPYERRIFHSALQAFPGIATHSEGEDPNRHIVISPVKIQEDTEQTAGE